MIAWKLLLALLPDRGAVGLRNRQPMFRDWAPDPRSEIDEDHYWQVTRVVFELASDRVAEDPDLWADLIPRLDDLPAQLRERALDELEAGRTALSPNQQVAAWEALRDLARRHREFPDAKWAISRDSVERLEEVASLLEPSQASLRDRWLFDDSYALFHATTDSDDDDGITERRVRAVQEIWQEGGLGLLSTLADTVKSPWALGAAAGQGLSLPLEECAGLLTNESQSIVDFASTAIRIASEGNIDKLERLAARFPNDPEIQASLVLLADDLPRAWAVVEAMGQAVEKRYWAAFYPFGRGADFPLVNETARKLLDHDRWARALDLMSHFVKHSEVDGSLIVEGFTSLLREGDEERTVLSSYEIANLLDYLRKSERIPDDVVARLEWQLLPALGSREISTLQRNLSASPDFFVEVLSMVYRRQSSDEQTLATEAQKRIAGNAWRLLNEWKLAPGAIAETGEIDGEALVAWVEKARRLLEEADRVDVGESHIGQVLAHSPEGDDGIWPAAPVRDFLETYGTKRIFSGIRMGVFNKRGVTTRGITEGGTQEYALAQHFDTLAKSVNADAPKTARMLREISDTYRKEGALADASAQRVREGFSF